MPQRKKNGRKRVSPTKPRPPQAALACLDLLAPVSDTLGLKLQHQICSDLTRHLEQTAACDEFLQILRDTVTRFHRQSRSRPDPALAAAIYDTIIEQYNSLINHRPSPRSRRARL